VLAGCPHGYGFTNAMLNGLVREGLATIEPGTVCAGSRRITVVWVAISDFGREVIAAQYDRPRRRFARGWSASKMATPPGPLTGWSSRRAHHDRITSAGIRSGAEVRRISRLS
jgi:hypothetical protein